MCWPFGPAVCMWGILSQNYFCYMISMRKNAIANSRGSSDTDISHSGVGPQRWQYVTTWITVFFDMYNTLMKHYEDGRSFFGVYLHRHVGIVYGGNWSEEHIRVFISAKHYENLITDIFQSEDIFFKTILLHWYNSECSFPSKRMKCGWSWNLMVVVVRIWRIIIVGNAHWIRVTKKFCTFSMKNARISKFTFDYFTQRDGLSSYCWLQFIEKGLISQMCYRFLFMKASNWKSSYFASE